MADEYNPDYVPSGPNNRENPYRKRINRVKLARVDKTRYEFAGTIRGVSLGGAATVHVIPLLGQSNMVGWAPLVGDAITDPRVTQLGRDASDMQLIAPTTPLHHLLTQPGWAGPEIGFVPDYLAANPHIEELILVPCAEGGSGFGDDLWGVNDTHYLDTVARLNHIASIRPNAFLPAFLWHQGEEDAMLGTPIATYEAELDATIAGLRNDVTLADANTPFLLGEMVRAWVDAGPASRYYIQVAVNDTPNRVSRCGVVSSVGLAGGGRDVNDIVHFTSASYRTLGQRYAALLPLVASDTPAPLPTTHQLSTQPIVHYDFLDQAAPLTNKGTRGALSDLVISGDIAIDPSRGLVISGGDTGNHTAPINYTQPRADFTFFAEVTFDVPLDPGGSNLISATDGSDNFAWWIQAGKLYFHIDPNSGAPFDPVVGQTYQLASSYRHSDRQLSHYANGELLGQWIYSDANNVINLPGGVQIGKYKLLQNVRLQGALSRIAIFPAVLTPTDIGAMMADNVEGW